MTTRLGSQRLFNIRYASGPFQTPAEWASSQIFPWARSYEGCWCSVPKPSPADAFCAKHNSTTASLRCAWPTRGASQSPAKIRASAQIIKVCQTTSSARRIPAGVVFGGLAAVRRNAWTAAASAGAVVALPPSSGTHERRSPKLRATRVPLLHRIVRPTLL